MAEGIGCGVIEFAAIYLLEFEPDNMIILRNNEEIICKVSERG